jgi:glutathione S-transferase
MSDYDLYYWSVPFRGQFVRAVLAYAGKTWTEGGDAAISSLIDGPVKRMPVPLMGPPMLIDKKADFAIAEMPAIILYLGETLDLMPAAAALRAMTMKIVNDANDVIDEITLDGGREMWTKKRWQDFVPRLKKWMSLWEETGGRHGLKADSGFLLGGEKPGIADVVTATLWSTMADRFGKIESDFSRECAHDSGTDAAGCQSAAAGEAGCQGPARLWRRLLRRPDRGFAAQGPGRLSATPTPTRSF